MQICIDEAGRGPLAGPLYSGLVLIVDDSSIKDMGFRDSKKLSEQQREEFLERIEKLESDGKILASFGICDHKEIDRFGMTRAQNISIVRGLWTLLVKLYTNQIKIKLSKALCSCDKMTQIKIESIVNQHKILYKDVKDLLTIVQELLGEDLSLLIDGKNKFGLDKDLNIGVETLIDGDDLVTGISMASIVAKVNRDKYMSTLAKKYKKYMFEKHKGYGTKLHMDMIAKHGIAPIHRKLFLKNIFPEHKIKKFDYKISV